MGKVKYINPTMSRKGLAGDACAIIRIHEFLEKWGLINLVHKKNNPSTLGLKDNKEH
jgi:SWI/SNF related-matrix-associated actin-dependent regulator of chromatin subfamily C